MRRQVILMFPISHEFFSCKLKNVRNRDSLLVTHINNNNANWKDLINGPNCYPTKLPKYFQ